MFIRTLALGMFLVLLQSPAHSAPPACNAGSEGTIVYNKDHKALQFCNSTDWVAMSGSFGGSSSVWLDGGAGKIYYSAGAVGIGGNVTDPTAVLQVIGGAKFSTDLTLGGQVIVDLGSGNETRIQANPAGVSQFKGSVQTSSQFIIDDAGNQTRFQAIPAGVSSVTGSMNVSGNVGVGNASPQTRLDVTGSLKVGNGSELCNAAVHEGAIRYVAASDQFQMCRASGTGWESIGTGSVVATIADNAVTNAKMADDAIGIAELTATGTPSASTYLRGDNTWAVPSVGGGGGGPADCPVPGNTCADGTKYAGSYAGWTYFTTTADSSTGTYFALAVSICDNLVANGKSDWVLPPTWILPMLYENRQEIGGFNTSSVYWSASEDGQGNAWTIYFLNGGQYYYDMGNPIIRVRCVRRVRL